MEKPLQQSLINVDTACFDTCKSVKEFKNLHFLKNNKIDLIKVVLYNDANFFQNVENKIVPYFAIKMLVEGTEHYSHEKISEIIDFYGVYLNSLYGKDVCQLSMLLMSENFYNVIDVFQEIACCPKFSEERLEHIKNIDLQNLNIENSKNKDVVNKEFLKLIFGEKNVYGYFRTAEDIKKVSIADLNAFFDNCFKKNLKCIVAGNIKDEILDDLSVRFQNILKPGLSFPACTTFDFEPKKKILERGSEQEYLCMGKICIPANHEDYKLLWCCVMFLGGYFGSRLMTNIREKGGFTYGINASLNSLKNCSYLCIKSSLKKNCSDKILEQIKNEILLLQNEYVSSAELNSFKQFFIGDMMMSSSNPFIPVSQFKAIHTGNLEDDFYSNLAKTIIELTPEQILLTAKRYLNFDLMSTVILK